MLGKQPTANNGSGRHNEKYLYLLIQILRFLLCFFLSFFLSVCRLYMAAKINIRCLYRIHELVFNKDFSFHSAIEKVLWMVEKEIPRLQLLWPFYDYEKIIRYCIVITGTATSEATSRRGFFCEFSNHTPYFFKLVTVDAI